ncbi:hypothetical protein QJ48_13655 [Paenibacillus sp. A3]|nr:hypothetical protein QJ48_13655 [Paenibacillus sp. A3]
MLGLAFIGRLGLGAGPAESVSSEKLWKKDSQTDQKQDTGDYDDVRLDRQGEHLALRKEYVDTNRVRQKTTISFICIEGLVCFDYTGLSERTSSVCSIFRRNEASLCKLTQH